MTLLKNVVFFIGCLSIAALGFCFAVGFMAGLNHEPLPKWLSGDTAAVAAASPVADPAALFPQARPAPAATKPAPPKAAIDKPSREELERRIHAGRSDDAHITFGVWEEAFFLANHTDESDRAAERRIHDFADASGLEVDRIAGYCAAHPNTPEGKTCAYIVEAGSEVRN